MSPLAGAKVFLDALRARYQVVILSDTFYEFADPLMRQLGRPTLMCHRLMVDGDGFVTDYRLRQPDQKRRAVECAQEPQLPRDRGRRLVQRHRRARRRPTPAS